MHFPQHLAPTYVPETWTRVVRVVRALVSGITPRRRPAVWFWMAFLSANFALFLPSFLFGHMEGSLFPWPGRDVHSWQELFIARAHVDVLRLNVEWVVLNTLWVLWPRSCCKRGRRLLGGLMGLFLFLALGYQVYAAAMRGIYHSEPVFFNDIAFVASGLRFVMDSLHLPPSYYVAAGIGILGVILGLLMLLYVLLKGVPREELGMGTRGSLLVLTTLTLLYTGLYGEALAEPRMEVSSVGMSFVRNIERSFQARHDVYELTNVNPYEAYNYASYPLRDHPNVYLIFVESYGSVLYRQRYFRQTYVPLMQEWEKRLREDGWHMVTTLSESPTWGGGSWMAYTSAMFGLYVHKQPEYLALRQKYQVLPYPNLGRYLHSQGYEYVWVTPIARSLTPKEQEENEHFYGADRWVLFPDLNYQGPLYGWGPSPPDQYTLGYIGELLRTKTQPVFLFFLTQTTHFPWVPLPPVVDDWRQLAHLDMKGGNLSKSEQRKMTYSQNRRNYLNAVEYDINMLGDFLLHLPDDNALVILIGDHQPPAVSGYDDGYATPVHILSRNAAMLSGFEAYGFRPGLVFDSPRATMKHQGLYSMVVRELVAHAGVNPTRRPPYLPEGLTP